MPKAPNQKYKLFYILELLRSESDEKHPVTMPQIISYLKQNGIHAERKSVYSVSYTHLTLPTKRIV